MFEEGNANHEAGKTDRSVCVFTLVRVLVDPSNG